MTCTIVIDRDYGPDAFWTAFRAQDPGDPALREVRSQVLRASGETVPAVPNDVADGLLEWARGLPEFEGPDGLTALFLAPDEDPEG